MHDRTTTPTTSRTTSRTSRTSPTATPVPTPVRPAERGATRDEGRVRTVGRWMVSFTGFPLGGLTAHLVVGPVDGPAAAIVGGLITGVILGAIQWWGLGPARPRPAPWIGATGLGLLAGLTVGAAAVDHGTGIGALAVMGAISGLAVGVAQAVVLRARLGVRVLAWPPVVAGAWALGWTITTAVGVDVDARWTVFGSGGAITVTALTAVLPLVLNRRGPTSGPTTTARSSS